MFYYAHITVPTSSMLPFAEVSLIAVLAASVLNMIIGSLWYSPMLFGSIWMQSVNISKEDIQQADMKKAFTSGFLNNLLMVYFLGLLIALVGPGGVDELITMILVTVMATVIPDEFSGMIWEHRPMDMLVVNGGYSTVTMLTSGILLYML